MRNSAFVGGVGALLLAAGGASAQWSDNFDSYTDGQSLDGVGGWAGWDDIGIDAPYASSAQSRSSPLSAACGNGYTDGVHPYSGYTSGQWTYTAYIYIPSDLEAPTYYILQNVYNHGGPYDWAVQMVFDTTTGEVHDDMQDFYGNGSNYLPFDYDRWVEIRSEIDLDTNFVETYYDGQLLSSGEWDTLMDGDIAIANVDLYGPHNGTVYYDDMSLEEVGGDPCDFADFDDNGVVDTRDFSAFFNKWVPKDPAADCDGNGTIDTRDVTCFLNVWNSCRP